MDMLCNWLVAKANPWWSPTQTVKSFSPTVQTLGRIPFMHVLRHCYTYIFNTALYPVYISPYYKTQRRTSLRLSRFLQVNKNHLFLSVLLELLYQNSYQKIAPIVYVMDQTKMVGSAGMKQDQEVSGCIFKRRIGWENQGTKSQKEYGWRGQLDQRRSPKEAAC